MWGVSQELGIHVCTAWDVGQVVRKDPAQGTLLSVQWYPVRGKALQTMNVCIRVPESLCCPPDTKPILEISYPPIQLKKEEDSSSLQHSAISSRAVCPLCLLSPPLTGDLSQLQLWTLWEHRTRGVTPDLLLVLWGWPYHTSNLINSTNWLFPLVPCTAN